MQLRNIITLGFASLAAAGPVLERAVRLPTNFYLVSTTQSGHLANSSHLKNASVLTLFDPYYQTNYLLRTQEAGYGFVPNFTLSDGTLHSYENGPHNIGEFEFNSTEVHSNSELQFAPSPQGHGDLSLKNGYLLAVNGSTKGWKICDGELEQSVIEYKGNDTSCVPTYIQAVAKPPY